MASGNPLGLPELWVCLGLLPLLFWSMAEDRCSLPVRPGGNGRGWRRFRSRDIPKGTLRER